MKFIQRRVLQQKQLWLELHFDITLTKPDLNML